MALYKPTTLSTGITAHYWAPIRITALDKLQEYTRVRWGLWTDWQARESGADPHKYEEIRYPVAFDPMQEIWGCAYDHLPETHHLNSGQEYQPENGDSVPE
jgi:hypothetical protein